ncbi:MAG: HAD family phosphatase [Clostridia bacterium]|nr:HAD family phosphatase [Clostridia bacterium]
MIKAVLFDMDGTVFDTERIYREAWFYAAEAVGFGEMEGLLASIFGTSEKDIGTYVYKTYGEDFPYEKMLSIRAERIANRVEEEGVPLKAGVPEAFDRLREKGIVSALATSAPKFRVDDFLARSGLREKFSAVITGELVTRSKPAPDIFLLAAKELGLRPEECMVVEDSHNGAKGGYNAGMPVVLIPDLQPFTPEIAPYVTHHLNSLEELPRLFA